MDFTIGFYVKFCIKMVSFIKIGPFLNSAALGGLGGKMAAPGRREENIFITWSKDLQSAEPIKKYLPKNHKKKKAAGARRLVPKYPY